jgi:REP-associated tyrosine transposase
MPRIARAIAPGLPHHVVQRGNNKDQVFFDWEDRRRYLALLKKYAEKCNAPVLAYCLMSNHVHLLIRPTSEASLCKMMQGLSLCYTQHINRKYGRTGRLWESRYHSCIVEQERYLWAVARYIEQNPVRARMTERAEEYLYSSARVHVTGKRDLVLGEELFSPEERRDYVNLLSETVTPEVTEGMRYYTRRGTPFGDEDFVKRMETELERRLVRRPRGRPRRRI